MQRFARIVDGRVAEPVISIPDGLSLDQVFDTTANTFVFVTVDDVAEGWTCDGTTFSAPPESAGPTQSDLIAYAASVRYARETGGIKVGNAQIDTSRESQAMVANAYQFMQVSGAASTQYKTSSGWVTVSADQMKAIALAVGAHVQACFAAEADLDAKITAGAVTTVTQIDAAFAALTT